MENNNNTSPILHCDGSWTDPWAGQPAECRRVMVLASNGLFQVKRVKALDFTLIEAATLLSQPGPDFLRSFQEYCKVSVPDRIPVLIIRQIHAFFRDVTQQYHLEAAIDICWSPIERKFIVLPPIAYQQMSATGILSLTPRPPAKGLYVHFCWVHSHNNFEEFCSGIDNEGEKADGFNIVIGNNHLDPSMLCSVVVDGKRRVIEPQVLIDGYEPITYPLEWMKPVEDYLEAQTQQRQSVFVQAELPKSVPVTVTSQRHSKKHRYHTRLGGR